MLKKQSGIASASQVFLSLFPAYFVQLSCTCTYEDRGEKANTRHCLSFLTEKDNPCGRRSVQLDAAVLSSERSSTQPNGWASAWVCEHTRKVCWHNPTHEIRKKSLSLSASTHTHIHTPPSPKWAFFDEYVNKQTSFVNEPLVRKMWTDGQLVQSFFLSPLPNTFGTFSGTQ
jgi:hypothetical protein